MNPNPTPLQLSDETIELLQRQNEIDRRLLALKKDCGIAFYRPHWGQHSLHIATAKRRGCFTGNRYGKSKWNAAETCAWMLGERPWYRSSFPVQGVRYENGKRLAYTRYEHIGSPDHPFLKVGIPPYPTKQLIICVNWKKVGEIWTEPAGERPGYMWQFLPKGFAKGFRNHEGIVSDIRGENGSSVEFMSIDAFKRNPLIAESSNYDRVAFDEPPPEELWKGLSRSLVDRGGQGDFAITLLEQMWIHDKFTGPPDTPLSDGSLPFRERFVIEAAIYDNPHLSDEDIERFERDLNDDEKQCRLHGKPLELSGLVYKEFRRDSHILTSVPSTWRDYHLPSSDCILYARVDPHPQTPHAVLFAAIGPSELPVICHEIWLPCDADTLAEAILSYVKSTGCFLASLKLDPAAWNTDSVTRVASIAKTLNAHGLPASRASKDLTNGILKTRSLLKQNRILFAPTLRRTLWEISRYAYDKENRPRDKDDHMMENLRRLCIDYPLPYFNPDRAGGIPIPDEDFVNADLGTNY